MLACGTGDSAANGHYLYVRASEYRLQATAEAQAKQIMHFDAGVTSGQPRWQIYAFTPGLFHKPVMQYAVNVSDLVDPPGAGWFSLDGTTPPTLPTPSNFTGPLSASI